MQTILKKQWGGSIRGIILLGLVLVGTDLLARESWSQGPGSDARMAAVEGGGAALPALVQPVAAQMPAATRQQMMAVGRLPLFFIANQGQLDPRVAAYVQGPATTFYFTPQGLTLALTGPGERDSSPEDATPLAALRPVAWESEPASDRGGQRWVLKLDFVGANPAVMPTLQDPTPAVVSYFKGPRQQWHTGLPTYVSLRYPDLWPGIDLVYSSTNHSLKYTFVVQPGADPDQIRLAWRGADRGAGQRCRAA